MVRGDEFDPTTLRLAAWVDVAMHLISLLTAILAIALVHRITNQQEQKSSESPPATQQPFSFGTAPGEAFSPYPTAPGIQGNNPFSDAR